MKYFYTFLAFAALVSAPVFPRLAQSAVFKVNQFDDPVPMPAPNGCNVNGSCTLREAVLAANAGAGEANEIHLPAGPYKLEQIGEDDTSVAGDLDLLNTDNNTLKIIGDGADLTSIDASAISDRIFHVPDLSQSGEQVDITIEGLTLTNGLSTGDIAAGGGMLFVPNTTFAANLTIRNCHFLKNSVIPTAGMANVVNGGGGLGAYSLDQDHPATVSIFSSTFSENVARTDLNTKVVAGGGLILFNTNSQITNSTISNNTVNGFDVSGGGGLAAVYGVNTTVSVNSSTIANNKVQNLGGGGGILIGEFPQSTGVMNLQNTIVADNTAPVAPDCIAVADNVTFNSLGFNIVKNMEGCNLVLNPNNSDQTGIENDPQLLPLANYGGPTPTHALAPDTTPIDRGNDQGCEDGEGNVLTVDQRGQTRTANGRCDVGAFELGLSNLTLTKNASVTEVKVGDTINYTIKVTNEGPDLNFNVVVTDDLPDELNFVSVTPGAPTCQEAAGKITCAYGLLQIGESKEIVIAAKVVSVPANGTVVNTAKVNGTENDTSPGNDPDSSDGVGSSTVTVIDNGGNNLTRSLSGSGLSCSLDLGANSSSGSQAVWMGFLILSGLALTLRSRRSFKL